MEETEFSKKTKNLVSESIYVVKDTMEDLSATTSSRKKKEIQREYTNLVSGLVGQILKHSQNTGVSKLLRKSTDRAFINLFFDNFSYRFVGKYALTIESPNEIFIYFTSLLCKISYESPKKIKEYLSSIFFDRIFDNNVEFLENIESFHDSYPIGAWLLKVKNSSLIFLFFKGTGFFDARSWETSFDFETLRPFEDKSIECHKGYYMSLILKGEGQQGSVYERIVQLLKDYQEKHPNEKTDLVVTGHSAAGGLASTFSIMTKILEEKNVPISKVFTYGCPRVGNAKFCSFLRSRCFRIVHNLDLIPKIPEWLEGHGNLVVIPKKYGLPCSMVTKMRKTLPLISFRFTDHYPGEYFRAIAKFYGLVWRKKKWEKFEKSLEKKALTDEEMQKKLLKLEKTVAALVREVEKERKMRKKIETEVVELKKIVKKSMKSK